MLRNNNISQAAFIHHVEAVLRRGLHERRLIPQVISEFSLRPWEAGNALFCGETDSFLPWMLSLTHPTHAVGVLVFLHADFTHLQVFQGIRLSHWDALDDALRETLMGQVNQLLLASVQPSPTVTRCYL